MNPRSTNNYTRLVIAIVLASVLVSATLYATVGQAERTITSTSTSTTTEYTTESLTTTSTVSSTITSTYFLTTASFQTTTSTTVSGQSLSPASFADPANESFQLVQATIGQTGDGQAGGAPTVNATFHSELTASGLVSVEAVAYSAETTISGGFAGEVFCCPIVKSYSQAVASATSYTVEAAAHAQFSPILALPSSLNGTYLVKLYVTSSNGTLLSPISNIFLQVQGGVAYGGQADAGPSFFDNDNGLLYVADGGVDAITVINGSTSAIVATISLPDVAGGMSFDLYDPSSSVLYVSDGGEILAVNTTDNFIVGSLNGSVSSMAYDPATDVVYGFGPSYIFALNGPTSIAFHITGIQGATRGIYDAQRQQMLVAASNGTLFALLRTGTSSAVGSISNSASIFLYDPDNGMLYASNSQGQGRTITAISSSTLQPVGGPIMVSNSSSSFLVNDFLFYDHFNGDIYFYEGLAPFSDAGDLIAVSTQSGSVVASISVPGVSAGLVIETPSFVCSSSNGDIYATEITNPQTGAVGLLEISPSTNTIVSQTFPPGMPLNYITLDPTDGMLYGAYGSGSSTIFALNLATGTATTLEVGTVQDYTLPP